MRPEPLAGFRIGVTSDRRSGDLISALERRGAEVLHAPALTLAPHDHDQDAVLVEETRAVIATRPDIVLVTTGYGMRRWFEVADAAGLGAELSDVLEGCVPSGFQFGGDKAIFRVDGIVLAMRSLVEMARVPALMVVRPV